MFDMFHVKPRKAGNDQSEALIKQWNEPWNGRSRKGLQLHSGEYAKYLYLNAFHVAEQYSSI